MNLPGPDFDFYLILWGLCQTCGKILLVMMTVGAGAMVDLLRCCCKTIAWTILTPFARAGLWIDCGNHHLRWGFGPTDQIQIIQGLGIVSISRRSDFNTEVFEASLALSVSKQFCLWSGIDNLVWAMCWDPKYWLYTRSYSSIPAIVLVTHLYKPTTFIFWHLYWLVRNLSLVPMLDNGQFLIVLLLAQSPRE
jgi:hypothetical protein